MELNEVESNAPLLTLFNGTARVSETSYNSQLHLSRGSSSACKSTVDFVLAYEKDENSEEAEKRTIFENNLKKVGLILETEENQQIYYVKIRVPQRLLRRYSELLKLRLPIKYGQNTLRKNPKSISLQQKLLNFSHVSLDEKNFPERKYQLTTEFRNDKAYLFDVDNPNFFDASVRITVASYILANEKFGADDQDKGIKRLVCEGTYQAAYPLHDGGLNTQEKTKRKLLADEWASLNKWKKHQPIDEIKDYFGVKFALYFTWLGFYTCMLIPAALAGILYFIYAASTFGTDRLSSDVCTLDVIMCPRCNRYCDYWKLNQTCTFSKIQHFIDNPATIFFALFMSFWAALYLELWKRYSAEIAHRWGLTGLDLQDEPPRPEYLIKLSNSKKKKLNIVTHLNEPVVPFWRVKLPSIVLSFAVVILLIVAVVAVVFGIVIYRMSLITSESLYKHSSGYNMYVVPITAGLINLGSIVILNSIYSIIAKYMTEIELQRTQTEFDDSLAVKIYMFQFVNYYSSIFYIAFLKGKFVGYPFKYNKILGHRQEECNPGGCLMELTIQLAIIMIGKQAMNVVLKMMQPPLIKMFNSIRKTAGRKQENHSNCQWVKDYNLSDCQSLLGEYLEMVLQYGFVTIFITAFPLAPLFALINNVLEMRLDAKKFIKFYRRPIPQRVTNIGVWFPILSIIGRISVVTNAFIIAFSSNFIPRLVYMLKVNKENHTDEGFLEHSLAYFNVTDFPPGIGPENSMYNNVTVCRYSEYRNPASSNPSLNYKRPIIYWHILTARLAFVVVFQNVVTFVITVVDWIIPDMSKTLSDLIKREIYATNEIIIKNEETRRKSKTSIRNNSINI